MRLQKREWILIGVAALMVIVVIVAFVRDRDEALLKRTLPFDYTSDMKVVEMDKRGMLLNRTSYDAKIRIKSEDPLDLIADICEGVDTEIEYMGDYYIMYDELETFLIPFKDSDIIPEPDPGTMIWAMGVEDGGHDYYFILDVEGSTVDADGCVEGGDIYLYVYYTK